MSSHSKGIIIIKAPYLFLNNLNKSFIWLLTVNIFLCLSFIIIYILMFSIVLVPFIVLYFLSYKNFIHGL